MTTQLHIDQIRSDEKLLYKEEAWKVKRSYFDEKGMLELIDIESLDDERPFVLYGDLMNFKLLRRPWSDLTKEITHKGEMFVPGLRINITPSLNCAMSTQALRVDDNYLVTCFMEAHDKSEWAFTLTDFNLLKEWAFPVGLADDQWVDMNQLKNAPEEEV